MSLSSTTLDLTSPASLMRRLGYEPAPAQASFLADESPERAWRGARGAGKSTAGVVLALHAALSGPGRRVLVVAPTGRDGRMLRELGVELGRRVAGFLGSRAVWADLRFDNGSAVRFMDATAGPEGFLGIVPDLAVIDHAGRFTAGMVEAIRDRTVRRGRRLALLIEDGAGP